MYSIYYLVWFKHDSSFLPLKPHKYTTLTMAILVYKCF